MICSTHASVNYIVFESNWKQFGERVQYTLLFFSKLLKLFERPMPIGSRAPHRDYGNREIEGYACYRLLQAYSSNIVFKTNLVIWGILRHSLGTMRFLILIKFQSSYLWIHYKRTTFWEGFMILKLLILRCMNVILWRSLLQNISPLMPLRVEHNNNMAMLNPYLSNPMLASL